jgi:hypothetical protein
MSSRLAAGISSRPPANCRRNGFQHFLRLIQVLLDHRNCFGGKTPDYIIIAVVCFPLKVPQILLVIFNHVLRIGLVKFSTA